MHFNTKIVYVCLKEEKIGLNLYFLLFSICIHLDYLSNSKRYENRTEMCF